MKRLYPTFVSDTTPPGPTNSEKPLLICPAEAARLLSLAPRTIYALVAAGTLPCVRIGRSVRIPRKAVLSLAEGIAP